MCKKCFYTSKFWRWGDKTRTDVQLSLNFLYVIFEDAAHWEQAIRLRDLPTRPDLIKDRGQYLSEQMMLGKWALAQAYYTK